MITRAVVTCLAVIAATAVLTGAREPQPLPQSSASVLASAREAIGGAAKVAAVKSLRLRGHERSRADPNRPSPQPPNDRLWELVRLGVPTEIAILLPDRFLRLSHNLTSDASTGVSGARVLYVLPTDIVPGAATEAERVSIEQLAFARLMLLLLARTDTAMPLRASTTTVNAGDGRAVVFRSGSDGTQTTAVFDPRSSMPMRLEYRVAMRTMEGRPTGEIADFVMTASDRRSVGGLQLPFRVTTTRGGSVAADYVWETIDVNPVITAADFAKYPIRK